MVPGLIIEVDRIVGSGYHCLEPVIIHHMILACDLAGIQIEY